MIDLHSHSTISDGTFTPSQIIQEAKNKGLKAIAITDHDSIDGLFEAQTEADKLGLTFVKGIELSCAFGENRLLHILGLGLNTDNKEFQEQYTNYRQTRASKIPQVIEKLKAMGIHLNKTDLSPFMTGGFMDRQAIAKCMVAKGYTSIVRESWIKYLDKINYTEGELFHPKAAIKAIHAAGGKAFLAHFHLNIGFKGYSNSEIYKHLTTLKGFGLDGLERYYPSFTSKDMERCDDMTAKFGFHNSGGTDFHGANRPHIQLGVGEGDFSVPDELLDAIVGSPFKS